MKNLENEKKGKISYAVRKEFIEDVDYEEVQDEETNDNIKVAETEEDEESKVEKINYKPNSSSIEFESDDAAVEGSIHKNAAKSGLKKAADVIASPGRKILDKIIPEKGVSLKINPRKTMTNIRIATEVRTKVFAWKIGL